MPSERRSDLAKRQAPSFVNGDLHMNWTEAQYQTCASASRSRRTSRHAEEATAPGIDMKILVLGSGASGGYTH